MCEFELNDGTSTFCGMEQDNGDQFDWSLGKGSTPSGQTGPRRAYNGDFYIFIEASKPRRHGETARYVLNIAYINSL